MLSEMLNFKKRLFILVLIGLIAAFILTFIDWGFAYSYFHNMMLFDNYAIAFSGLLILLTFIWFLMSRTYFTSETSIADHYALILFSLAGGIIMVSFGDLTMFFIGLEILSVSMYVLAGSDKLNLKSNESSLKYFMLGAFATGFLLFGIALIYGTTSSLNLRKIALFVGTNYQSLPTMFYVGIIMLLVGLLFKVSAVPFHFWAPDVYDGAPTVITAFMATIVKTAAFAAFYRLFSTCFSSVFEWWTVIIVVVAAMTMLLGNIIAVSQKNIKRMLAYSSVSHAGYMLMALVALNQSSQGALLFYSAVYSLTTLGIFALLNVIHQHKISDDTNSFKGLAKSHPLLAVIITIFLLSMAGIPPVAGFFAKYYIFYAVLKSDYLWLVLIAVFSSLIGVYYYFRIIISMFTLSDNNILKFQLAPLTLSVLIITCLLTLILGIVPSFVISLI